jgi:hypothetical protein
MFHSKDRNNETKVKCYFTSASIFSVSQDDGNAIEDRYYFWKTVYVPCSD